MNKANKLIITDIIYNNLPAVHPWLEVPRDKLLFQWWATGRGSTNLRLTEEGKTAFDMAEITFYDYDLKFDNKDKVMKFMIGLGNKIACPFYLGIKNRSYKSAYIRIYDSKIAMLISLYGSVDNYLESIK
jgi:hypothetical protein